MMRSAPARPATTVQSHSLVRPERSRGACVMTRCQRPSTSLGTNDFLALHLGSHRQARCPSTLLGTNGLGALPRRSSRQPLQRGLHTELLAFAGGAAFELDHAAVEALWAEDELPREADQVHGRELGAAALVPLVVEGVDAGGLELRVEVVGRAGATGVVGAHVDEADLERRDGFGPDDARRVVARLDEGADEPGDADAVAAHLRMDLAAVGGLDGHAHRGRVFGAEIEN